MNDRAHARQCFCARACELESAPHRGDTRTRARAARRSTILRGAAELFRRAVAANPADDHAARIGLGILSARAWPARRRLCLDICARRPRTARNMFGEGAQDVGHRPATDASGSSRALPRIFLNAAKSLREKSLALGCAEIAPINAGFADRWHLAVSLKRAASSFDSVLDARLPDLALDRDALRHRRSLRQHAVEIRCRASAPEN